jgi:hypothetical protein
MWIPLTRQELLFYSHHIEGCYEGRLDFDPEAISLPGYIGSDEEEHVYKVVALLTHYADHELRALDDRPWWVKAQDHAAWGTP